MYIPPAQIHGDSPWGAGLVRLPDVMDGPLARQQATRWMQFESQFLMAFRRHCSEVAHTQRSAVGRLERLLNTPFEAGDIGEIGRLAGRGPGVHEVREVFAEKIKVRN